MNGPELPRRFKPYPKYKDSDVEWLREIPEHWDSAPVYARYEVALGKMLDEKRITGDHLGRYLRNVDVQWDRVTTDDLPTMDFAPRERERYLLRAGDLLVCEGGEVGRTAVWPGDLVECFYQKAIHRVRPSREDVPRYFYYLMLSLATRGVFMAGGNANTIDHLTATKLRHYRFPFPSRPEQLAIAAFLDRETGRIDALVAKKERLGELLQEKRAALITRAATKGLDPNVPMKDSGVEWLGEIPAQWEARRLKSLASVELSNVDKKSVEGEVPVKLCNYVDVYYHDRITDELEFMTATATAEQAQRFALRRGDVLITKDSETPDDIAVPAVVAEDLPGVVCGYHLAQIRPGPGLNGPFLARAFDAAGPRDQFHAAANGITRFGLSADAIRSSVFAIPPGPEQIAIAAFLDRETARIDALVNKVRSVIDRLSELRTALISAAVTGKIDVREKVS